MSFSIILFNSIIYKQLRKDFPEVDWSLFAKAYPALIKLRAGPIIID